MYRICDVIPVHENLYNAHAFVSSVNRAVCLDFELHIHKNRFVYISEALNLSYKLQKNRHNYLLSFMKRKISSHCTPL